MNARHVDAVFNGETTRFRFALPQSEAIISDDRIGPLRSPWATFQRFVGNVWTLSDLRIVLSVAYPTAGRARSLGVFMPVATVDQVLSREPPARYAPLAAMILEAYLIGLDPGRATFDERNPFGDVEPAR